MFTFFSLLLAGQLVSAEILMASDHGCPIEMHQISIEKCDEMYDEDCKGDAVMPFHRARYDKSTGQSPNSPREQVRHYIRTGDNKALNYKGLSHEFRIWWLVGGGVRVYNKRKRLGRGTWPATTVA